ncbi:hypothetical protein ACFQY4_31685 [Catellatospora bangladeshensis]
MTEHMLAVRQDSLGGPEVLRVAEVARPSPARPRCWCGCTRPG